MKIIILLLLVMVSCKSVMLDLDRKVTNYSRQDTMVIDHRLELPFTPLVKLGAVDSIQFIALHDFELNHGPLNRAYRLRGIWYTVTARLNEYYYEEIVVNGDTTRWTNYDPIN